MQRTSPEYNALRDRRDIVSRTAVQWLAAQGAMPLAHPEDCRATRAAIPATDWGGEGSLEILRLKLGMSFDWSVRNIPHRDSRRCLPLARVTAEIAGPVLVIHSVHAGQTEICGRRGQAAMTIGGGEALFAHDIEVDFTLRLCAGANAEVTTFIIGMAALQNILGEGISRTFLDAAGLSGSPSACSLRIPRRISSVLQSALPNGLDENMRSLFAHARALEYLCLLAVHVTGDPAVSGVSQRERQMQQLYEELLAMEGKIPALFELAERYGMSVKTLNDSFKRMFGQTINAFMTAHRLNEAHVALQETDIAMKVLAAQSGYSHVNNFINAFRHKFGYPPGSLRR